MSLFKNNFYELEKNNDIQSLIQFLEDEKWQNRYKSLSSLIRMKDSSAIEEVKHLTNDKNHKVQKAAINYLKMNNYYTSTKTEDIKLYPYNIKNPYILIKRINANSNSFNSKNDVNFKLKEAASHLGANALIEVKYYEGIFNFFRGVKGHGKAVIINDVFEEIHPKRKDNLVSGLILFCWYILFDRFHYKFTDQRSLYFLFFIHIMDFSPIYRNFHQKRI